MCMCVWGVVREGKGEEEEGKNKLLMTRAHTDTTVLHDA